MPLEPISHATEARACFGEIPIESLYTVGIAGERFFREIEERARFVGTRCEACDITYVPPRLYCERCFAQLDDWVEVGIQGRVYTYTILHLALDGSRLEEPAIVAFVQLDGADGGLVHRLGEVEPDQVEIGMRVEAVFKPEAEREGSILDIKWFRPL
ncbi:MAG TPA: Zn-ribbon domain-containing OB-fold protein [Anaerolineae bacterium]|nr:Zn-ribbon domain-containing OB-fold protein [Anaerolineae bacterium]